MTREQLLLRATPVVFVLIWSTGFVVARLGMPHAQPLSFLLCRYGLSALCFAAWVRASGATWPRGRMQWLHLGVTGTLIQAAYLGGVWCAVKAGLGAGLVALIVGLQPVLTALWVSARGSEHRVRAAQWLGLVLGLGGLLLVVGQKLHQGEAQPLPVALAAFALLGITAGTLYQKRWVQPCDVRTAGAVQLLAAFAVTLPLALVFEPWGYEAVPELWIALGWSVLVLTLGGSSLLTLLIQRGAATAVTSLMYLVPPCTAVMAWVLFRESLSLTVFLGMALTALGVALVVRQPAAQAPPVRDRTD
jgi:drug/metabolite transporter (DMT)-like permease